MKKQTAFSLALLLYSLVVEYTPNSYAAAEGDQKNNTVFELPLPVLAKCKPHIDAYIKFRRDQIATLATKYGRAIDARLKGAVSAKDAEAFRTEHSKLAVLTETLTVIPEKSQDAVGNRLTLPTLNSGTPSSLVDLRKIWIAEREKIELKSNLLFQRSLQNLEAEFSEAGESENAKTVLSYRQSLGLNDSDNGSTKSAPSPPKTKENGMKNRASAIASATKKEPFKNSLGMPFVPVSITGGKTDGITILFCIWETRVKDYAAFIRKNRDRQWKEPNFKQKNDHPAVNVSWDDAVAFCEWLTEIERSEGKIGNNEKYRLPSDHEWSCAVGIGEKEDADFPPAAKFSKISAIYPWGQGFPPKKGSGNYYGEENRNDPRPISVIKGYRDGFEQTSPVGSFDPNVLGLYDMGGNVWEWCQDWFDPERRRGRVYRGACWIFSDEKVIRSSGRGNNIPGDGFDVTGVRLVLSP